MAAPSDGDSVTTPDGRLVVISSDCHAGADLRDYRPYLESSLHDEFDAWADSYVNPFGDLERADADRNWDDEVRNRALDADGIAAEVVYPNTVPPFFPMSGLVAMSPTAEEFRLRLAGLRAHNRWLAEWCDRLPGRRAGIGQILFNDVDEAVRDVEWIADNGLAGGVLLPGLPPGCGLDPIHAPTYEPVWRACEERGVVLNVHGGSGSPFDGFFPATLPIFALEAAFYAHRPLWSLIMAGVFDRFPALRLVLAEAGSSWVATTLEAMDSIQAKQDEGAIGVMTIADPIRLGKKPSEFWQTNCWLGASLMARDDALDRHAVGVDRILWGSDFPHEEGSFPYSAEALAHVFAGIDTVEVAAMVGLNAAEVYRFDLELLRGVADVIGPRADAVFSGIDEVPADALGFAFGARSVSAS